MNILFVGLLYDPKEESDLIKRSRVGISVASNLFQWNVINGLRGNNAKVDVLGSIPFGNYPGLSSELFVRSFYRKINDVSYFGIGYINFYGIKHRIREKRIKNYLKRWIELHKNEQCVVIFYDLYMPFLNTMKWIKKYSNVYSCIIVPDLAGNLRNNMGFGKIKTTVLNYKASKVMKGATFADSYVILTDKMNPLVNLNKRPFVIVDGIIDENIKYQEFTSHKRIIMYAGALSRQYNINLLVDCFERNKKLQNLELWFCGKGDSEEYIKQASVRDTRIKYLGFVSKDELRSIEKNISFYINPRTNNGNFTKYSFPSKNLEYLIAGKPVIAYKLDGMSDDYDDIFIYLDEKDPNSIDKILYRISKMSNEEISVLSRRGFDFIREHNGCKKQGKKILEMLNGVVINEDKER